VLLAHGRDPNFPGWPDTFQLDYANDATQEAMIETLLKISGQCDGVRCDMAMLVLPEVFEWTWGLRPRPFWPRAIERVRQQAPTFLFMAEAYWDLEWELQQQGFDYTYDKRLYDRLRNGQAGPVRDHLLADLGYQARLVRFLENHDETRAAAAFPAPMHQAAAIVTFLAPGLRLFHQGQLEGRRKRISPHLWRAPEEPVDQELARFYEGLLAVLRQPVARAAEWQLLPSRAAWDGNWTSDRILAFAWQGQADERLLIVVNYASNQSQCYVMLPFSDLADSPWRLADRMSETTYDRDGADLRSRGLYLDLLPWQFHVFTLSLLPQSADAAGAPEGRGSKLRPSRS
jgi:hypothetical protein